MPFTTTTTAVATTTDVSIEASDSTEQLLLRQPLAYCSALLPAGLARDPDRIARFEREARAAGALYHPNIVAVYDIGRDNGTYWIAT